jgi:hypothetical protein
MAADYGADLTLSSIAALFCGAALISQGNISGFPEKRANSVAIFGTNLNLFAFAHHSCAVHQSFK